jgi:hypothetical protein
MTYFSEQYPKIILQKPHVPRIEIEWDAIPNSMTQKGLLDLIDVGTPGKQYKELTAKDFEELVLNLYNQQGVLMIDRNKDAEVSITEEIKEEELQLRPKGLDRLYADPSVGL